MVATFIRLVFVEEQWPSTQIKWLRKLLQSRTVFIVTGSREHFDHSSWRRQVLKCLVRDAFLAIRNCGLCETILKSTYLLYERIMKKIPFLFVTKSRTYVDPVSLSISFLVVVLESKLTV